MSGFDVHESGAETPRPVWLYEFAMGAERFRYTNVEDEVVADSLTWEPAPGIDHSVIEHSPEARARPITVTLPTSNVVVQRYIPNVPTDPATLLIKRYHRGDPVRETRVALRGGRLSTVQLGEGARVAHGIVLPIESHFSISGPRLGFSSQCPLMLYGLNCKAVRSAHLFNGTVGTVSADEVTITVPGLDVAEGVGWATSGEVVVLATEERRLVLEHVATDTLRLHFPFSNHPLNASVEVAAGCDRLIDGDCLLTFNNVVNNGSWPHVPVRNPMKNGF